MNVNSIDIHGTLSIVMHKASTRDLLWLIS